MIKRICLFLMVLLAISCSGPAPEPASGHLYIIGGGGRTDAMIERMVDLAGGENARILVITTASGYPQDTGVYQAGQFQAHGAAWSSWVHITGQNADQDSILQLIESATGIFFSGGDQRRLTRAMNDSPALQAIRKLYQNGGLVAGTSAGAAVMSRHMITGTELANPDSTHPFGDILAENMEIWDGFGFVDEAIIDQHHIRRKRFNRLLSATLENPEKLGIGIDETTALIVYPDRTAEVHGVRSVLIIDARYAQDIHTDPDGRLRSRGVVLHVLGAGDRIDLRTGKVTAS